MGGKVLVISTLHGVGDLEEHGLRLLSNVPLSKLFYFARPSLGLRVYWRHVISAPSLSHFVIFIPLTKSRLQRDHHISLPSKYPL